MKRFLIVATALGLVVLAGAVVSTKLRSRRPPETAGAPAKGLYQCAMHPEIVSDEPDLCPICQMRLQRVDEPAKPPGEPARRGEEELGGEGGVPGHAGFTLSPERQQLIGVRTDLVQRRALDAEVRTVGRVAYDPGLYQAFIEYREALRARSELRDALSREARQGADALVRAAALKLRQQGLSEAQIRDIARDGRDPVNLLLPGKTVWVYAQVYEYEVELIRPGQEMVVTVPSLPGRVFHASVAAIDPILNAMTRTARVRALVPTPDESLRPETFVNVTIRVPLGERVAVPESAVLDTGEHQIVFVVEGEGRFEPRGVTLGREAQGYYEVLAGVEPGAHVVTSANFLIDSESRFRSALAAFGSKRPGGHPH
jgi:Cu(I)/Ag(I) efflux system membrane fusion protein